jgi:hypothetical protein
VGLVKKVLLLLAFGGAVIAGVAGLVTAAANAALSKPGKYGHLKAPGSGTVDLPAGRVDVSYELSGLVPGYTKPCEGFYDVPSSARLTVTPTGSSPPVEEMRVGAAGCTNGRRAWITLKVKQAGPYLVRVTGAPPPEGASVLLGRNSHLAYWAVLLGTLAAAGLLTLYFVARRKLRKTRER